MSSTTSLKNVFELQWMNKKYFINEWKFEKKLIKNLINELIFEKTVLTSSVIHFKFKKNVFELEWMNKKYFINDWKFEKS